MTTEQINEAERQLAEAIAGIRDYLSLIAGVADDEELIRCILGTRPTQY